MLNVTLVPILKDNYSYIIQREDKVGIIDPGDAAPIIKKLEQDNLKPDYIFITHHHWDHTNGIQEIKDKYQSEVIGPEKENIKHIDTALNDGDQFKFGGEEIDIIEIAGHTSGHICFYFKSSKVLFSGDALFAMGCGRLFEGTAEDTFNGFQKLNHLPDDTKIYSGHEYTQDNAKFCLSVEPNNQALMARTKEVDDLRKNNLPTIPTTWKQEKQTNVFVRANNADEFKKFRQLKDNF